MKLVLEGVGIGSGFDKIVFKLEYTSWHPGFCMNASDDTITGGNDDDYSFKELENDDEEPGTMMPGRTWVPFWCKDYGGRCICSAIEG